MESDKHELDEFETYHTSMIDSHSLADLKKRFSAVRISSGYHFETKRLMEFNDLSVSNFSAHLNAIAI
jgi:hypothetical protein